jgi:hypothetical protein
MTFRGLATRAFRRDAAGLTISRYDGLERLTCPPLLATDGAVAEFGRDVRRLRPNILIGGVEGLAEREWDASRTRRRDHPDRFAARALPDDDDGSRQPRAGSGS